MISVIGSAPGMFLLVVNRELSEIKQITVNYLSRDNTSENTSNSRVSRRYRAKLSTCPQFITAKQTKIQPLDHDLHDSKFYYRSDFDCYTSSARRSTMTRSISSLTEQDAHQGSWKSITLEKMQTDFNRHVILMNFT